MQETAFDSVRQIRVDLEAGNALVAHGVGFLQVTRATTDTKVKLLVGTPQRVGPYPVPAQVLIDCQGAGGYRVLELNTAFEYSDRPPANLVRYGQQIDVLKNGVMTRQWSDGAVWREVVQPGADVAQQGPRGEPGEPGAKGEPGTNGQSATDAQVAAAVAAYMAAHPDQFRGAPGDKGATGAAAAIASGTAPTPTLLLGAQQDITVTLDRAMPNATYNVSFLPSPALLGAVQLTVKSKTTTTVVVTVKATLALAAGAIGLIATQA